MASQLSPLAPLGECCDSRRVSARRDRGAALGLVAAVCSLGIVAAPAGAAKPIKGAYYAGFDGTLHEFNLPYPSSSPRQGSFRELGAEMRVSETAAGSAVVAVAPTCWPASPASASRTASRKGR